MTEIAFYTTDGEPTGFEISGHSGYADEGEDIVCASISSCAYMVANTATEITGVKADIEVREAYMSFRVSKGESAKIKDLLLGFQLHVKALADDYSDYIVCKTRKHS